MVEPTKIKAGGEGERYVDTEGAIVGNNDFVLVTKRLEEGDRHLFKNGVEEVFEVGEIGNMTLEGFRVELAGNMGYPILCMITGETEVDEIKRVLFEEINARLRTTICTLVFSNGDE